MKLIKICIIIFLLCSCRESSSIQIIHITDTHADYDSTAWDAFIVNGAWKRVDAVLDGGDFCDELTDEMLDKSNQVPRISTYGNHEDIRNPRAILEKKNPRVHTVGAWTVLCLPYWTDLPKENIRWLRYALIRAKAPVMILTHTPLVLRDKKAVDFFDKYGAPYGYAPDGIKQILEIIDESGKVRCVLSGHHHQNYLAIRHGIPYISTVNLKFGYRILTLSEHSISSEFVPSTETAYHKSSGWRIFPRASNLPENHILGFHAERNFTFSF